MTDWTAAWAALVDLDGEAWGDDESERIEALWLDCYRTAFVEHAVERGWSATNAADWACEIGWMALIERGAAATAARAGIEINQEYDPAKAAHKDVIKTEKERG
jgi:hypothetical protein